MSDHTTRRGLLLGAAAASVGLLFAGRARPGRAQEPSPEARVRALGLEIPEPYDPVATYRPAVTAGDLLFVSGHTPRRPDGTASFVGKVGAELTPEEGREAARLVGLLVLGTLRGALGSLDRVERLVRTFGMVNAVPDFQDQPRVVNGFSDLMTEVFGPDAGKGVRAAVGMGSLPGGMAVEVETIWKLRS